MTVSLAKTLALLAMTVSAPVLGAPGWLAYGDLRGHVEPCGCDPATDLGGIRRLGAVIARERAMNADLGLFGLGNDVSPPGQHLVKISFLLRADALLIRPAAGSRTPAAGPVGRRRSPQAVEGEESGMPHPASDWG